jgi:hypothetical protein
MEYQQRPSPIGVIRVIALLRQLGLIEEAMELEKQALRRWPRNPELVGVLANPSKIQQWAMRYPVLSEPKDHGDPGAPADKRP